MVMRAREGHSVRQAPVQTQIPHSSFIRMNLHKPLASLKLTFLVCRIGVLTVPPSSLVGTEEVLQGEGWAEW